MKLVKLLLLLLVVALAFGGGYLLRGRQPAAQPPGAAAGAERKVLYWVDPMHPAYRSDKPGTAPDCGMALEPVYADGGPPAVAGGGSRRVLFYRDPAQPSYTAHAPGLNPETGNDLEPVYADDPSAMPAGAVRIAPERQQLIGVKFEEARLEGAGRDVRTVGQVVIDETRVGHVHTRVEGWAEQVLVDFTGDVVRRGQPMLTVYSPEMLASQQELLLARRARDQMKDNPLGDAARHGEALFEAARRRLQLWDLSDAQIQQVLDTGTPIRSVTVEAPMSGVVTERNVFPNQKVAPETDLYTIVDLSHVWVLADVFESDMALVRMGGSATVSLPFAQGARLAARVNYIQPQVDPATRALKVRLDVANPGMRLKPNMYVDVTFASPTSERLTVPSGAVVDTGTRRTVFVDLGNGYLEPRAVTTGDRVGDRVAVTSGLRPGERVVASGTFLVDSESQLKAALSGMGASSGHSGHGAPAPAPQPGTEAPHGPKGMAPVSPAAPPPAAGHDHGSHGNAATPGGAQAPQGDPRHD
jgi:RND family efflux transporter MFP subunit